MNLEDIKHLTTEDIKVEADKKYGSVTPEWILQNIAGQTYGNVPMPTKQQLLDDLVLWKQKEINNLIHTQGNNKFFKKEEMQALEVSNPTKIKTPYLDIAFQVIGFILEEGVKMSLTEDMTEQKSLDLYVRSELQKSKVFKTQLFTGRISNKYAYRKLWEKHDMQLIGEPEDPSLYLDSINVGDWVDEEELEDE